MQKKIIYTDRSNDLLKQYFKDINKYKIYSQEELDELIKKAQSGDFKARDQIITSNLKFVITIAKQFQNRGVPLMDLISCGNIGLTQSISKFNPDKGVPFLSYAVWWIKQNIYKALYWQGKPIRLPVSQQLLVLKIINATSKLTKELGRFPSNEEISKETKIPIKQVDHLAQFYNNPISVDDFIHGDEENNQICDIIANQDEILPDDELNSDYILKGLEKILPQLSIREHDIIVMIYGIGMPKVNKKTICAMYNVTYERVRQIKDNALKKLRTVHRKKLEKLL